MNSVSWDKAGIRLLIIFGILFAIDLVLLIFGFDSSIAVFVIAKLAILVYGVLVYVLPLINQKFKALEKYRLDKL